MLQSMGSQRVGHNLVTEQQQTETHEHFLLCCNIKKKDKEQVVIPKKASDQCKEIEENNRMEKSRDLFKKIRDTKGTFHAKMGSMKDRNGMDLTEAEDIKKRWQEYTEELY